MEKSSVNTLSDLVKLSAQEHASCKFIREKQGNDIAEKTFAEFYEDCKKVYSCLKPMGKIHTAIIGPTSYNYLVSRLGTVIGGNAAVPIDAQLSCDDICDLLRRADVSVFFYDSRFEKYIPHIKEE